MGCTHGYSYKSPSGICYRSFVGKTPPTKLAKQMKLEARSGKPPPSSGKITDAILAELPSGCARAPVSSFGPFLWESNPGYTLAVKQPAGCFSIEPV